jgi:hypothetical protein
MSSSSSSSSQKDESQDEETESEEQGEDGFDLLRFDQENMVSRDSKEIERQSHPHESSVLIISNDYDQFCPVNNSNLQNQEKVMDSDQLRHFIKEPLKNKHRSKVTAKLSCTENGEFVQLFDRPTCPSSSLSSNNANANMKPNFRDPRMQL